MKFRIRCGKQRFVVEVLQEDACVGHLRKEICRQLTICGEDSSIGISLNGVDLIEENERSLHSLGLVNGDLVYAHYEMAERSASNDDLVSQLLQMGFDKEVAMLALKEVNYSSIDAALDVLTKEEGTKQNIDSSNILTKDQPSTSKDISLLNERRVIPSNSCNPVFCRDGISQDLETLYEKADVKTPNDAMFILIHALMLESGFYLMDSKSSHTFLPSGWNTPDVIKLQFKHQLSSVICCQLVFSSLGPFIYCYIWSKELSSVVYQVKLTVSHYVRSDVALRDGAKSVFKNLHKVSRVVKNDLVHPFLASLQSYLGITSPFSLSGLPPEIQLMVLSQLVVCDLISLSATCKSLHVICNDEKLWQYFCQRDFGTKNNGIENWKKHYKMLHQQRQRYTRQTSTSLYQEYPDIIYPRFNPFLPRIPQIIGGPHDLFPDFITGQPRDESHLRIFHPDDRSRSDLRLNRSDSRGTTGTFFA